MFFLSPLSLSLSKPQDLFDLIRLSTNTFEVLLMIWSNFETLHSDTKNSDKKGKHEGRKRESEREIKTNMIIIFLKKANNHDSRAHGKNKVSFKAGNREKYFLEGIKNERNFFEAPINFVPLHFLATLRCMVYSFFWEGTVCYVNLEHLILIGLNGINLKKYLIIKGCRNSRLKSVISLERAKLKEGRKEETNQATEWTEERIKNNEVVDTKKGTKERKNKIKSDRGHLLCRRRRWEGGEGNVAFNNVHFFAPRKIGSIKKREKKGCLNGVPLTETAALQKVKSPSSSSRGTQRGGLLKMNFIDDEKGGRMEKRKRKNKIIPGTQVLVMGWGRRPVTYVLTPLPANLTPPWFKKGVGEFAFPFWNHIAKCFTIFLSPKKQWVFPFFYFCAALTFPIIFLRVLFSPSSVSSPSRTMMIFWQISFNNFLSPSKSLKVKMNHSFF